MSGERTPGVGEKVKNVVQSGEVVQEVGPMLWGGATWGRVGSAQSIPDASVGSLLGETAIGLCNLDGTFDQMRNNYRGVVAIAAGAYTTTQISENINNYNHTKMRAFLHVIKAGSGTITMSWVDSRHTMVTFPACSGVDQTINIAPGLLNNAGESVAGMIIATMSVNMVVPKNSTLRVTPSGGTSWEYEVIYELLV